MSYGINFKSDEPFCAIFFNSKITLKLSQKCIPTFLWPNLTRNFSKCQRSNQKTFTSWSLSNNNRYWHQHMKADDNKTSHDISTFQHCLNCWWNLIFSLLVLTRSSPTFIQSAKLLMLMFQLVKFSYIIALRFVYTEKVLWIMKEWMNRCLSRECL